MQIPFKIQQSHLLAMIIIAMILVFDGKLVAQNSMYHPGWIDFNKNGHKDIYENPLKPIEKRIKNLIGQMSTDQKTCQLYTLYGLGAWLKDSLPTANWKNEVWKDGVANIDEHISGSRPPRMATLEIPYSNHANARNKVQQFFVEQTSLGIPADFSTEGIRGLCHTKATFFPCQLGQGSSWNKELIYEIGKTEAKEALRLGFTNVYAPILDMARDPRWGRTEECYGEDPFLVGTLGKQMVVGLQTQGVISTAKHFAVYSIPAGGRDGACRTAPSVTTQEFRSLFLEPWRMAVQEAGMLGLMVSYNEYNGIPSCANSHLLTDILRKEWGFKGYNVTDSDALEYLYTFHFVAPDYQTAIEKAINAGVNVRTNFMDPKPYLEHLRNNINAGKISQKTLNSRVTDVLRVKFKLGLFDKPYVTNPLAADSIVHSYQHQLLAMIAAEQSIVLLKNEKQILPLSPNLKHIAVIGPNADQKANIRSRYGPADAPVISVLEGIRKLQPNAEVSYLPGVDVRDENFPQSDLYKRSLNNQESNNIKQAVQLAKQSDIVIMVLGDDLKTIGENYTRMSLDLPGHQQELLQEVYRSGTPIILILLNGRPITLNWANDNIPAILEAWYPGEFTGTAIANILWGKTNPSAKLPITFPKHVGQVPYAFPFKVQSRGIGHADIAGALYPFGFGLSYTSFNYSDIQTKVIGKEENRSYSISCNITNTGSVQGTEIVQLYLRQIISSVTNYERVLRGFERVSLEPGQTKSATFILQPNDLGLWNDKEQFNIEKGKYKVFISKSSEHDCLETEIEY